MNLFVYLYQFANNLPAESTPISPGPNLPQPTAGTTAIQDILAIAFGTIGALAVLMIVISGLRYITSAGNPEQTAKAKNGIIYALVGVVVAISAESIIFFVANRL